MNKYVIGLMSGTSLDGLDIAYIKFDTQNWANYKIIHAETIPYNAEWKQKLQAAFEISAEEIARLDADYGIFLAQQVNDFILKYQIDKVDLIASHGQTVFHRPESHYTTQIGSGAHINALTKIKTICDFRTQDVALGGQGAPLVPIGDRLLYGNYDYCLNIGGFANISYEEDNQRKAFDICPTNIVLNHYTGKLGLAYDDKGKIARSGSIQIELLNKLNALPFYTGNQPKSLGWEFVVDVILPLIDQFELDIPDILATYTEHLAQQIGQKVKKGKILLTGGGAHNDYIIERIQNYSAAQIKIPDNKTINFKEALIFALLGALKDAGQINILSSVTGSHKDHSSGVVYDAFTL